MSFFSTSMDKLKLTGRTLGRVFNSRRVCMHSMHLLSSVAIQPNLELKTWPKQLLGSLPLDIALPEPISICIPLEFKAQPLGFLTLGRCLTTWVLPSIEWCSPIGSKQAWSTNKKWDHLLKGQWQKIINKIFLLAGSNKDKKAHSLISGPTLYIFFVCGQRPKT